MSELRDFISFDGALKSTDLEWPMTFKVKISDDGELEFEIPSLPLNENTREISSLWSKASEAPHHFRLTGVASDASIFETTTLFFTSDRIVEEQSEFRIHLKARCSIGTITQSFENADGILAVCFWLRGFECFPALHAASELGNVTMTGSTPLPSGKKLSGHLQITSGTKWANAAKWLSDAQELLQHIRHIMSFAQSRDIKAVTTKIWADQTCTTKITSQGFSYGTDMPVFHFLTMQPIFDAAVKSFSQPALKVSKLNFAIDWFAMHTTYSETRLLNVITALENLINANLDEAEKFLLPPKRFDQISEMMRRAFCEPVGDLEIKFRRGLKAKMEELNRRPLHEKIMLLCERWNVELHDLPEDGLKLAIDARNRIVHRGHYYDDDPQKAEKDSLWPHVVVVREILVRIIFSVIGYRGGYVSFLGGAYHETHYPPLISSCATPAPTSSQTTTPSERSDCSARGR